MSTAADFDPNMASQVNLKKPPANNNGCLKPDDLKKYLNLDQFNGMMENVGDIATEFVNNFNKEQKAIPKIDDERYKTTALNKLRELREEHSKINTRLQRELLYCEAAIEGSENTKALFSVLQKKNEELKLLIENQIHIIEISDRKSYYENEQNEWAGWWAHHFMTKYWLLIFLMIIGIIITKQSTNPKKWLMILVLAIYPLVIFFILKIISHFWSWVKSSTTWVYLHSNI